MSRLQVGGLALYTPEGCIVKLLNYDSGKDDLWFIEPSEPMASHITGNILKRGVCSSKYLLPLGDKQTQDQFKKEECEA